MMKAGLRMASGKGGIDPAALAVASLAAAVSVIAPSGPYGPASMMIGLTILIVIFAYDVDPHRNKPQSVAFSAVCALISLLVLRYPLECAFASHKVERLHILIAESQKENKYSEVPPGVILILWVGLVLAYYWLDRRRSPEITTPPIVEATDAQG